MRIHMGRILGDKEEKEMSCFVRGVEVVAEGVQLSVDVYHDGMLFSVFFTLHSFLTLHLFFTLRLILTLRSFIALCSLFFAHCFSLF